MTLLALFLAVADVNVGDGVRLFVDERGSGSPIIVIHGGPGMVTAGTRRDDRTTG